MQEMIKYNIYSQNSKDNPSYFSQSPVHKVSLDGDHSCNEVD